MTQGLPSIHRGTMFACRGSMQTPHDAPFDPPSLAVPEQDLRDQRLERISARAFELYEARGGEHGQDIADWLEAERQIDDEIGQFDRDD